ncbi:hypothetical protein BC829DRAFT_245385 [Chytridium lagenaria]|nr:hypothetical protein BC829DRAFT_245385 [Chytridium lagenaria]
MPLSERPELEPLLKFSLSPQLVITTFSAFVLSIRQSLKFDAKKSGNPKLARWSVSNGIVVLHMITRSLQFSVVALMAMGPDPFIEFLVSSFTSPSENYFGISVALVIFYAVTHTLLISNLAPKIVTTWVGKNILKISALVVSFVGSAAIIPTLTVLFQTITCHYGGNGDSIRHPSEEFCSSPCWTSEHWTTSLLAFGFVLFGISMFISTANTWQSVDAQVDIKSRHWFNTVVTAATVTTSIANVWLRSSPFALSLFMSLLSFFLATLTFAYKPINVVPASQLAGYTFLVPGITGIIGVLANTFDAEKALWVILLVIGWASVAIAAFSFSLFGAGIFVAPSMRSANQRAFTFEMETGPSNGLHDRIMAAISSQKKKGTKSPIGSPIGSATVGDKDKDSKEKSLTPMEALPSKPRAAFFDYVSGSSLFSRNRLEAMTADFFERKLIVWAETGVISEATAFCIADAMERNDPYLQLIYDRIIVCGIADTNDSRLLQAVKFAAESKLLLSAEITAAPFTQPAAKASTISSSGKDERKPLLLGREESHSQVLGGEDMI